MCFSAQHREDFSVDCEGKLAIRRSLLTGIYTVMEVKCVPLVLLSEGVQEQTVIY